MTDRKNAFELMPRCGARTRSGQPCKRIGNLRTGRCKLHGGRAGAPSGRHNGAWRHGNQTKAAIAQRREIRALLREANRLLRGNS